MVRSVLVFLSSLSNVNMLSNANCLHCSPRKVAKDVIKEFAADGVKYLELRSTPREEKNTGKAVNTL